MAQKWRPAGATRCGSPPKTTIAPVQDPMVIDEAFFLAQPHDTQTSGHSSSAKRQDGSDQQDFAMLPDRLGEQGRKLYNQRQQLGRQCLQLKTSLGKVVFSLGCLPLFFQRSKMAKVELTRRSSLSVF
jgi:hypothetical protein